jgi:hypothetical protein
MDNKTIDNKSNMNTPLNKYKNLNDDKYKDETIDVDLKTLITNALQYYDSNMEKYENIFEKLYYKFKHPENNYAYIKLEFYNDADEFQFETRFEIFGEYFLDKNLWVWSWATSRMKQNMMNVSRQLWLYGSKLTSKNKFLRVLLTTSRFRLSNIKHIDTHLAISAYLTKTVFLYRLYMYNGKISYSRYGRLNNNNNPDTRNILFLKLIDHENIMEYIQKKTGTK